MAQLSATLSQPARPGQAQPASDRTARARDASDRPAPAPSVAPGSPESRARELCLTLLTARPRTRAELRQALLRKGVEADVADRVLGRLNDVGLVDDRAFAEMWVHSRHTYQGLGRRALAVELRRKGVDGDLVADAVAGVDADAEEERARELVRKRLPSLRSADQQAKIRRLAGMLARKGYSQGMAFRVVKEELATFGEETDLLDSIE